MRWVSLWLVCFALWVGRIYAARPFATDDAGTVETGGYELEIGNDLWKEEGALGIGFKHGLTDRMDVGVGFGCSYLPKQPEGFSCAELCLKFLLVPDMVAASITGGFGDASYSINGIFTKMFGPMEINVNLGYEATGIDTVQGTPTYAMALIFGLGKSDIGAEFLGDREGLQNWLIGGRYKLLDGFMVDAGLSGGFNRGTENLATFGLHYEF